MHTYLADFTLCIDRKEMKKVNIQFRILMIASKPA